MILQVNTEVLKDFSLDEDVSLGYASGKSNKVTNIIPNVCLEGGGGYPNFKLDNIEVKY